MQRAQHTSASLHNGSTYSTLQCAQLTAVQVNALVPTAQCNALIGRAELYLRSLSMSIFAERHLSDVVVFPARRDLVAEVVHSERARGGAYGNEGAGLVNVAAARWSLWIEIDG